MIYYLTPLPANKSLEYIGNPPVRLSLCLSVHIVSGSYLLTHLSDLDNISHNCCPWPTGVSWPWPKVISSRLKSQCAHIQNPVGPSLRTAMLDLDNISHNRIMTFTQGHIAKVKVTVYTWQKIVSGPLHYHFTGSLDGDDTSRNCCSSPWGCCCGGICPVRHVYFIWRPHVIYLFGGYHV